MICFQSSYIIMLNEKNFNIWNLDTYMVCPVLSCCYGTVHVTCFILIDQICKIWHLHLHQFLFTLFLKCKKSILNRHSYISLLILGDLNIDVLWLIPSLHVCSYIYPWYIKLNLLDLCYRTVHVTFFCKILGDTLSVGII